MCIRDSLDGLRQRALAGELPRAELAEAAVAAVVGGALARAAAPRLRAVYNLTGTVLHTNLGRALLPDEAVASVLRALCLLYTSVQRIGHRQALAVVGRQRPQRAGRR